VAKITTLLSQRQANLRRVIHNFQLLSTELSTRDSSISAFVVSNNAVFQHLANQDANIQATLQLLPPTLVQANTALAKTGRLANALGPSLSALRPAARALGPALVQVRPFLKKTTPIIKNQLRPFTVASIPTIRKLNPAARDLAALTPNLVTTFKVLNYALNELAFNPPGSRDEGFLFYHRVGQPPRRVTVRAPGRAGPDPPWPRRDHLLGLPGAPAGDRGQPAALDDHAAGEPAAPVLDLSQESIDAKTSSHPRTAVHHGGVRAVVLRPAALPLAGLGGSIPLSPKGWQFEAQFNEATNLAKQADVRISGVSVGKVTDIQLAKDGRSSVTMQLKRQYAPLPVDAHAILRQKTLLGET